MGYLGTKPANALATTEQIGDGAVQTSDIAPSAITPSKLSSDAQFMGFKNRIINGAMQIDQRNAGASVTPVDGQYIVDRWLAGLSQPSKFTVQQNAGSVTPPVGFVNYLGATSSSAYPVGAGEVFCLIQKIEGFNVADLAWGTANAQSVTLSFQVRSSLTGTFGGSLRNSASNRSYPFSYSIPVANTWTTISVTIPGDQSGTWLTNNGVGISVLFSLGAGSSVSNTAGAWVAGNYLSTTGATSVVGTNGATFYITGVQLEKGSTATSFDYRPYGTELALCQRYYQKSYNTETAPGTNTLVGYCPYTRWSDGGGYFYGYIPARTTMRATPTMTFYTVGGTAGQWQDDGATAISIVASNSGANNFGFQFGTNTARSTGQAYGHFVASAEL